MYAVQVNAFYNRQLFFFLIKNHLNSIYFHTLTMLLYNQTCTLLLLLIFGVETPTIQYFSSKWFINTFFKGILKGKWETSCILMCFYDVVQNTWFISGCLPQKLSHKWVTCVLSVTCNYRINRHASFYINKNHHSWLCKQL